MTESAGGLRGSSLFSVILIERVFKYSYPLYKAAKSVYTVVF